MESAQLIKINGKEYALIRACDPSGKEHQFLLPSDLSVDTLGRYIAVSSPSGPAAQSGPGTSHDRATPTLPATSGDSSTTNIWSLENSNWTPKLGTDLDSKWLQRIQTDYMSSLSQSAARNEPQNLAESPSPAKHEPQHVTSSQPAIRLDPGPFPTPSQLAAKLETQQLLSAASFSQADSVNEPRHLPTSSFSVARNEPRLEMARSEPRLELNRSEPRQLALKQVVTTAKLPNTIAQTDVVSKPKPNPVLLKSVKSPTEVPRTPIAIGRLDANKKLVLFSAGNTDRSIAAATAMKSPDAATSRTLHGHIETAVTVASNLDTTVQTVPDTVKSLQGTTPVYKSKLEKAIAQNNMNIANSHSTTTNTAVSSAQNDSLGTLKRLLNSKAMAVPAFNKSFMKGLDNMTSPLQNDTPAELEESALFAAQVEVETTPSVAQVVRKSMLLGPLAPKTAGTTGTTASGELYKRIVNPEQTLLTHVNYTGSEAIRNPNFSDSTAMGIAISNSHAPNSASLAISNSRANISAGIATSKAHINNRASLAVSNSHVNISAGVAIPNSHANNSVAFGNSNVHNSANIALSNSNVHNGGSMVVVNSRINNTNSSVRTIGNLRANDSAGITISNYSSAVANYSSGTTASNLSNTIASNLSNTDPGYLTDPVSQFSHKPLLSTNELPLSDSSVVQTGSTIPEIATYSTVTTVTSNTSTTAPANNAATRLFAIPTAVLEKVLKTKPVVSTATTPMVAPKQFVTIATTPTLASKPFISTATTPKVVSKPFVTRATTTLVAPPLPRAPPLKHMAQSGAADITTLLPSDPAGSMISAESMMMSTNQTVTNYMSSSQTATNGMSTNRLATNHALTNRLLINQVANQVSTSHMGIKQSSTNRTSTDLTSTSHMGIKQSTSPTSANQTGTNSSSTNQTAGIVEKAESVLEMEYSDSCLNCMARDILAGMWRLRQNDMSWDAVLLAGVEHVKLHKVVLAGVSAEMYTKVVASGDGVLRLQLPEDITGVNLYLMVYYMYHGTIKLNIQNVQQLYRLSAVFHLEQLKKHCYDFCRLARMGYLIISSPYQEAAKQIGESAKPSAKRRRTPVPLKDKQVTPPTKQPQPEMETPDTAKSPNTANPRKDVKTPTDFEWLTSPDLDQSNMPIRKRVRTRRGLTGTVTSTTSETVSSVNTAITTTAISTAASSTDNLLSNSAVSLETAEFDKRMTASSNFEKKQANSTEVEKKFVTTKQTAATANLELQKTSPPKVHKRVSAIDNKQKEVGKSSPAKSEPIKANISETPKKKAVVQESLKEKLADQSTSEAVQHFTELPDPLASGKIDESELLKIVPTEEEIVTPTKTRGKVKASPTKTMVTRFRNRPKNMSVIEAASQKKAKSNDTSSVYTTKSPAKTKGKGKNQTAVKSPKSSEKSKLEQSIPVGKSDNNKTDKEQGKGNLSATDNTFLGIHISTEPENISSNRPGKRNDLVQTVADKANVINAQKSDSMAATSNTTQTDNRGIKVGEKLTRKRLAAALAKPAVSLASDASLANDASIAVSATNTGKATDIGAVVNTVAAADAVTSAGDAAGSHPDKHAVSTGDADVKMAASPPKKARLRKSTTEQQQVQESPKDTTVYMRPPPKKRTKEIREMMKHEEDTTVVEEVKHAAPLETLETHEQRETRVDLPVETTEIDVKLLPQPLNMDQTNIDHIAIKMDMIEEKKVVVKKTKKTSLRRDSVMVKQVYDIESSGKAIDGEKQYRCHLCNNVFIFARRVVNHLVSTHDILLEEAGQYVSVEPKSACPKICDICGYKTKELNIYYIHYHKYFRHGVPLPKGWTPFTCDLCKKEFFTKFQLREHKLIHFEDNPFVCDICGSGFKSRTCLNSHVFHKHSSVRRFACVECPKTFKTSTQLKVHKRIHSGDKPFACPDNRCTYRSTTRGNMRLHLVNRHKFNNDYVKDVMAALQPSEAPSVQIETEIQDTDWAQAEAEPSRYPASRDGLKHERDLNEERAVEMASDPATLTTLVEAAVAEVNSAAGYQELNETDGQDTSGMVPSLAHVDSMASDLMEQDHTGNQAGRDYDMNLVHSVQLVSGMGPADHEDNPNSHMTMMVEEEVPLQQGSDLMVRHQDQNSIGLQNYHQSHGQHSMSLISLQEYREPDHPTIASQAYSIPQDQRLDVSHMEQRLDVSHVDQRLDVSHVDQRLDVPHQDQRLDVAVSHQMPARPRLDPDSREARMIVKEVLQGHEPRSLLKAAILQGSIDGSKLLRGTSDSGKLGLDSRSFVDTSQPHSEHQFPEETTLVIDTHPEQPQLVIADDQVLQGIRMQEPFRDSHSGVEMFRGGHSNTELFRPSHSNAIFRGDNDHPHHQDLEQAHLQPFQSTSMEPPPSYNEQSHGMMTAIPVSDMSVSHAMEQGRYQGEAVQTVSLHHPGDNQPQQQQQQQTSPQLNPDGSSTYGYYQQNYPIENF